MYTCIQTYNVAKWHTYMHIYVYTLCSVYTPYVSIFVCRYICTQTYIYRSIASTCVHICMYMYTYTYCAHYIDIYLYANVHVICLCLCANIYILTSQPRQC